MDSLDNLLAALDRSIANSKKTVEIGAAVGRLMLSRDFKRVILDGYFKDEATRLVHELAKVENQSEARRVSLVRQMDSVANLKAYMDRLVDEAGFAEKDIALNNQSRDQLIEGEEDGR